MAKKQATIETVVEKIQKLLNMTTANGCTPDEAANAAVLAEKLLTEHKLSVNDVLKKSFESGEAKAVAGWGVARDTVSIGWANGIAVAVAKLCFCSPFQIKGGFSFVGFREDVEVASALMDHFMLHGQASMEHYREADWKKFKKDKPGVRYPGIKVRGEFLTGYGSAVALRLRNRLIERDAKKAAESTKPGKGSTAIVSVADVQELSTKAIKAWEDEQRQEGMKFGKGKRGTVRQGKATAAGYLAGINAPLDAQQAIA